MARSGKILVCKRDGTIEPFDLYKLRGCLLRVVPGGAGRLVCAGAVAEAVGCYLASRCLRWVSSAAILEMVLTVLRAVGWGVAAGKLERRHSRRLAMRGRLTLRHYDGRLTAWSKGWLVQRARSQWSLGRSAGRILAGQVEDSLMRRGAREVHRADVMRLLARRAADYGLAGLEQPAGLIG